MIDFLDVTKSYGARDIFNHASFRVEQGEHAGIVGPNGSGKSTLFALLTGELSPDHGEIVLPKKTRLGHLHQQLDFFKAEESVIAYASAAAGELPKIRERMQELETLLAGKPDEKTQDALLRELGHLQTTFEHMGGYDMPHRAAEALAGLGFSPSDMSKPMGDLSGGWQMRACMARVILGEPDVLLLDEPSNYLDTPAVEWLSRQLRSYDGTLLLISHDRFLLNSLTQVTIEVDHGKITRYAGNYQYYVREREARRRQAEAAAGNLERRKDQLERNIDRFRYKASKAAQVQSWIKMLDKIEDVEVPDDLHFRGTIRIPDPPHSGVETVRAEQVGHSYDGQKTILSGVDLRVERGEKVGIIGYNGAGKSTLLRILSERMVPTEGTVRLGHQVIVGYQAQEFAELLTPEMSVFDIVKEASGGNVPSQRIREILGSFGFSGEDVEKPCRVLSGGEKIRLCFARIFVNPPNFLVLDEPTTHLDIAAREALQESIRKYQGTVCMVSHDIEFLRGTADVIVEVRGHHAVRYGENYDSYRERVARREAEEKNDPSPGTSAPSSEASSAGTADFNSKDRRRERAARRQELAKDKKRMETRVSQLEKQIGDAETEKSALIEELSNAGAGAGFDFAGKQKRLNELDSLLVEAESAWEAESAALEELMKEYREIGEL